ncbi:carboxylesterase/lipase family protein [Sphingomonas sp. SUN039]|uniref:carboxylesterase/lipase family protein n=1 Tax=Sphingomonas sp. SUN039 TaxID=2937787 RepID=UPI002164EFDE|nr:carboxylesterase family protein [Sphingomonas sp. SUN039]UVO53130.1 carboxylesterase family protein [Sphingomonas sp. SUN039]
MIRALLLAGAATALIAAAPAQIPERSIQPVVGDPVATDSGRVAGTQLPSGVHAYLGIPFAAPPTGDLRWAAPQPLKWTGVMPANRKGAACIQVLRPHDINHYFGEEATSEDCLYMNLWSPAAATPASKLPVIVFIYGGGFTIGSSGMANYDGESVAKAGAVFVNFNYRVGAMGFMAHPELTAEQGGHSGNYGLMDQIAALKWVRANIAKFGGDPDKVLIMGQSAGAGSVISHIFSPQSKGLFRAAVMSSGCNYKTDGQTLAEAEKAGLAMQERFKASSLAALRNVPADRILAAQSENQLGLSVSGVRIGGPIIDGFVLPVKKAEALAAGNINRVPVIASYNSNDLSFGFEPLLAAKTVADYTAAATKLWGEAAPEYLKLFPVKTDADVPATARRAATEAGLESSARFCAREQARLGLPAWIDEYARVHPYVPGVRLADQNTATVGAYHTADIPYFFGTQDAYNMFRPTRNWTPWDRELSAKMMGSLIAMAATGSPDTPAMRWSGWTPKAESKIVFGDSISTVKLDPKRLDWLAAHPASTTPVVRPRGANPID